MNKNQKKVPYTFSGLILGRNAAIAILLEKISRLERQIKSEKNRAKRENRKADTRDQEYQISLHKKEIEEHQQERDRLSLCFVVCGDPTVLIR